MIIISQLLKKLANLTVVFSHFWYRPIFIETPLYQQRKVLLKWIINDNKLYVCTALQIYSGFIVQILLQSLNLKQEADLPQIFILSLVSFLVLVAQ